MARNLPDADIIISTPFHPAYVTRGLIEKACARMLAPVTHHAIAFSRTGVAAILLTWAGGL